MKESMRMNAAGEKIHRSKAGRRRGAAALLLTAVALPSAALAAKVSDVISTGESYMVAQLASQKRVDGFSEQRRSLEDEYRSVLRESDGLRLYLQQLSAQLRSQQTEMDVVRNESREIERTNIEILPLMNRMLETLEQFVALDLPFLAQERRERIHNLKALMPRADVSVSEKYRRIIEAYQIEVDYGRTIEAYRSELGGKSVDVLRAGRVALMYQTPDGSETGYWDAQKKAWVRDGDYRRAVSDGLKIAKKQSTPNLLIVPVLAAKK